MKLYSNYIYVYKSIYFLYEFSKNNNFFLLYLQQQRKASINTGGVKFLVKVRFGKILF